MASLLIRLLGPPQVGPDRVSVSDLRSDKAIALLAYLVVESDRAHRREKLAGMLWPGFTESSARANLRRALADLRQAIGDQQVTPTYLHTTRQTIQFTTASDAWVDVTAFATLLESTKPPDRPDIQRLEEAAELYRGPFLDGFSLADSPQFEEWVVLTREQLYRLVMEALHRLADEYEEQGEYERALPHTWRQLELDPWRENAHRQAMRLLALGGQRDSALAQYEMCRQLLKAELGAEPSEKTQQLYQRLLKEEWPPPEPVEVATQLQQPRAVGECPYRGLAAFRQQDAPFFFGREEFTASLLGAIQQRPFITVIVGSSGSGKSSAVFAGLLPQLKDEELGDWLVAHCRPGGQPFHTLAAALLPLLEPQSSETDRLIETQKLATAWQAGDLGLFQAVERVVENQPDKRRLLLVTDQFEELYTLCPEPDRQREFLDLLLAAVEAAESSPAHAFALLLTLRADFMGQALAYRPLADALQEGCLMLGPMNRDELRTAIVEPAQKQGAAFEPGLADRMLDDVGEEPGNLPLLEFALTLLWEQAKDGWLTHGTYEALGRVEGALARYAERVFADLDPGEQERIPHILTQLAQPGRGTEATRRVATRDQVGETDWPLTRRLADERLVVTGQDAAGNEIVEVAHEALIQHWGRLRGWLATNRAFRVWQESLRTALRQWEDSERDDGALLRGAPLAQAEEWLAARANELSQAEKAFIDTSVSLREQRAVEREAQRQRELDSERRSRRLLGALAGVLAIATVIAIVLTFFSTQQRRQALEAYSLSLAANAREALNDLDNTTGLALALAASRIESPPQEAQRMLLEAAYAPGARWRGEVASLFEGVEGPITALDIGPDGRTVLAGLVDGGIVVWDFETKEETARLSGHTARVNDIAFGPDGSMALSGADDAQAILWDLETGKEVERFGQYSGRNAGVVRAVDISPDGSIAATGGFAGQSWLPPGELILWDLENGEEIRRLEGHIAGIVAAEFTPAGDALLASSGDAEIFSTVPPGEALEPGSVPFDLILWDVQTGVIRKRFETSGDDVYDLAISPDGTRALTASYYNNVSALWDLETGERLRILEAHQEGVHTIAFGPDGRRALTGSYDDSLVLWDVETGQPIARLDARSADVLDLSVSPDGRTALSSSGDGGLILWDLIDAAEIQRLAGHGDFVWDVALMPDGKHALSSSGAAAPSAPVQDASIRFWDLETGAQLQAFDLPVDAIMQVAISPDGRTALISTNQAFIRVWNLESWQEIGLLEGHAGPVTGIEFAPDGQRAMSVSVDGTLILWNVPGRQALYRFGGHGEGLWSVAISPDGRRALSDSGDSSMVLWDLETGEEIRSFVRKDSPGAVGSSGQAFLPGGRTAISCEQDGSLIEWDLESGEQTRRLGEHPSLRTRVIVSSDGDRAMTSGMDGSLMLWDLESGELLRRSDGHGVIFDLALSPDGQTVLFGSSDTTISQWQFDSPSFDELKAWVATNRYLPELTCAEREMYQIEPLCDNTGAQQATQP
jgi:WD40 repeat protein/DNA-binding SARP family transcriptional activator